MDSARGKSTHRSVDFFADQVETLLARLIILVLNTMIIFSVAVGTNVTGKAVQSAPQNMEVPTQRMSPTPTPSAAPTQPPFESLPISPTATPTPIPVPAPKPTPFFHDWF